MPEKTQWDKDREKFEAASADHTAAVEAHPLPWRVETEELKRSTRHHVLDDAGGKVVTLPARDRGTAGIIVECVNAIGVMQSPAKFVEDAERLMGTLNQQPYLLGRLRYNRNHRMPGGKNSRG